MEKNLNFQDNIAEKNIEEEVDLRAFIFLLMRNKILIGTITFLSFLISSLYSLTLKKVWEGQFQIVLNSNEQSKVSALNPTLSGLIGVKQNSNNLKTQVEILQSPFVLRPIYDLVNETNKKDATRDLPFKQWKYNLDIELEPGTSVLNISYRDTNKDIILPALIKMS